jgi:Domain of unknown function (DUF4381)
MNVATPPPQPQSSVPEIRDIAPPIDVFPYPLWMVIAAAVLALIVLGLVVWLIVRTIKRRPPPPPLTPRAQAIRELEALRSKVEKLEPYAFSIEVSDVLRRFITAQYGLHATQQTSPEFLAAISRAPEFSNEDRVLLERFLERCDLIKFAHIDATQADSSELLRSAIGFVQGGRT